MSENDIMASLCIDLRWIDSSGVGIYIQGILPGLVESLADISIIGLGDVLRLRQYAWSSAPNVRLVQCSAGRYSLAEQVQLPLAIPAETDLFFSPYYTIPLLFRGRLAVTVHDMSHLVVPEITSNSRKRVYAQTMFRALRRRAEVIFTVSEFSKRELIRLTGPAKGQSIMPIHLGVSAEWYTAATLKPVREGSYFVHVGNIKPYKNVRRLVEAFLKIKDRVPHNLLLVGQSEGLITGESADFFDLVRSAGERVHLTGFVSREELLSLVAHADALVMPSTYEGFGLPPLEAMAAGVPAVVAQSASLPEVCGDAALYFDPLQVEDIADKLSSIATNPNLRDHLRTKGRERSTHFHWSACAAQTAEHLRQHLHK